MKHQGRENLKSLVSFVSAIQGPTIKRISFYSTNLPFMLWQELFTFPLTIAVFHFLLITQPMPNGENSHSETLLLLCKQNRLLQWNIQQSELHTSRNSTQLNATHTTQAACRSTPTYLEVGAHNKRAKGLVCGIHWQNYNTNKCSPPARIILSEFVIKILYF